MRGICFIIILILFTVTNVNAITIINEIMYNPEGSDNNHEFIEIFSDEINNFTNYTIEDLSGARDLLTLVQYVDSQYSLIVEDGFDYSNINASVYTLGATIGNSLNNDQDITILRNGANEIIDLVYYNSDFGANDNGKSLERIDFNDFLSDPRNLVEGNVNGGTPGSENSIPNIDFNEIVINEILPDPFGNDDASMPDGEFVELYNNANEDINLDNFYLEDEFGHRINIGNTHTFTTTIDAKNYLVVYMNGFSGFLNNDEDEVKLFYNNILVDDIDYSTTKEGFSWAKLEDRWILNHPTPNQDNNQGIIINKSSVRILDYDDNAKFGDLIEVKLNIYKGNTQKNAINLFIENDKHKISEEVNFNIFGKFVNYTINVPLQIYYNCEQKYEDGEYELKVTGLEQNDKKEIKVSGINSKLCNIKEKKGDVKSSSNIETESNLEHIESSGDKLANQVIYESSDVKARNFGPFIFIIGLILIIIFLIFRKGL